MNRDPSEAYGELALRVKAELKSVTRDRSIGTFEANLDENSALRKPGVLNFLSIPSIERGNLVLLGGMNGSSRKGGNQRISFIHGYLSLMLPAINDLQNCSMSNPSLSARHSSFLIIALRPHSSCCFSGNRTASLGHATSQKSAD
jgi:hypothetical protein